MARESDPAAKPYHLAPVLLVGLRLPPGNMRGALDGPMHRTWHQPQLMSWSGRSAVTYSIASEWPNAAPGPLYPG